MRASHGEKGKAQPSCAGHTVAVILFLLGACVALSVVVIIYTTRGRHSERCGKEETESPARNKVCLTPDCVQVAALYLGNMDLDADPCDDFFTYTCGNFVKNNPLKDNELVKDLGLNSLSALTDEKLVKLVEQEGTELYGQPSEAVRKLKDLHAACRNTSASQRNTATRLQQYIDRLGGWSLSGGIKDRTIDIEETAARIHRRHTEGLFKLWPVPNPFNSTRYQLRFQPSAATFPSAALYRPRARSKSRRRLAAYINSAVSLLGGNTNSSVTWMRIEEIIDIERTVMELTPPDSFREDPAKTYNTMTLGELQELLGSKFQVVRYVSRLLKSSVDEDYLVLVESPQYMSGLQNILNNYTDIAITDYLVWTWIHAHISFFSRPFVAVYETFSRRQMKFDKHVCLQVTKMYFNQVLGALYVEKHYDSRTNTEVSEMMVRLRRAFSDNLRYVGWMEDITKNKTLEKVESIKEVVGYLDMHTDRDLLDLHYAYAGNVSRYDFLDSIDNLQMGLYRHALSLLGRKQTITMAVSETQAPYDTGATYARYQNTILVWAGLMQYAFYDYRLPAAAKFGSLGFVVGHEVTHAFDNNGKNYDKDGAYIQWWDNVTLERFDEQTRCYVDQYSNYSVADDRYIDGNLTLSENIADNAAVKIAYSAYKSWLENHGGDELEAHLPGFNLMAEQLFFVGMAMPLCTVEAEILSRYNIKHDVHSKARYRVIGPLSNFEHFSTAFNCRSGSRMSPPNRCSLW